MVNSMCASISVSYVKKRMATMRDTFQKAWRRVYKAKSGSAATGKTGREDEIIARVRFLEGHTKSSTKPQESHQRAGSKTPKKTPKKTPAKTPSKNPTRRSPRSSTKKKRPADDNDEDDDFAPETKKFKPKVCCFQSGYLHPRPLPFPLIPRR